ncbi:ATP-binding protein [Subtercola frigoramans]|uniref:Cdc6-like AAA superfamily ATPase n=1 Tax=Subtercola frigoramans TaxID=120298 RepID=A0ABS2L601_9MICO|nr:ATP-binding protein [Subtercola frigoramans]MBM7472492.1 Cdc6-like AAA superfamily ATPase [Subtercola frigoramans]
MTAVNVPQKLRLEMSAFVTGREQLGTSRARYVLHESTHSFPLIEALVRDGAGAHWGDNFAWRVIRDLLLKVEDSGWRENPYLVAAKHLLALDGPYDDDRKVPGRDPDLTIRLLRRQLPGSGGSFFEWAVLRRSFAARALGASDPGVFKSTRPSFAAVGAAVAERLMTASADGTIRDMVARYEKEAQIPQEPTDQDRYYQRPRTWQNREQLVSSAVSDLQRSDANILQLHGEPGMGKSLLAPEILRALGSELPIVVIRNSSEARKFQDLRLLRRSLGQQDLQNGELVLVDFQEMIAKGSGLLGGIVLDGIESVEALLLLCPEVASIPVVVTSQSRFDVPGMAHVRVREFRNEEAKDYLLSQVPDLDPELAEQLRRRFANYPLALHAVASYLVQFEGLEMEARAAEVLRDPIRALGRLTRQGGRQIAIQDVYQRIIDSLSTEDDEVLDVLDALLWLNEPVIRIVDHVPGRLGDVITSNQVQLDVSIYLDRLESFGLLRLSETEVEFHAITHRLLRTIRVGVMETTVRRFLAVLEAEPGLSRSRMFDALRYRVMTAVAHRQTQNDPEFDEEQLRFTGIDSSLVVMVDRDFNDERESEHGVLFYSDLLALDADEVVEYGGSLMNVMDTSTHIARLYRHFNRLTVQVLTLFEFEMMGDLDAPKLRANLVAQGEITEALIEKHFSWARAQLPPEIKSQWPFKPHGHADFTEAFSDWLDKPENAHYLELPGELD